MAQLWVNIGSGKGLLPDDTKPLPEPVLAFYHWGSVVWKIQLSNIPNFQGPLSYIAHILQCFYAGIGAIACT